MEKLKKHQKLEKAMRDYPHGTRLISAESGFEYSSSGVFFVSGGSGNVYLEIGRTAVCVYKASADRWAIKEEELTDRAMIIESEDGTPLYPGDDYHRAYFHQTWRYDTCNDLHSGHAVVTCPAEAKAFSTKEAAELWIKEQNKPKEITISINDQFPTKVVYGGAEISTEHGKLFVTGRELEVIYDAYKSLQS